jgi:hypothetical protein
MGALIPILSKIGDVEDRKMMCTQGLRDYDSFYMYSLKILAHFRSKVLEDFPHYVTQVNCLTGAIISETFIRHILRRLHLTTIRSSTRCYFLCICILQQLKNQITVFWLPTFCCTIRNFRAYKNGTFEHPNKNKKLITHAKTNDYDLFCTLALQCFLTM